jgi:hypothetical protein
MGAVSNIKELYKFSIQHLSYQWGHPLMILMNIGVILLWISIWGAFGIVFYAVWGVVYIMFLYYLELTMFPYE